MCLLAALGFRHFCGHKGGSLSVSCHWFPFVMSEVKILMVWSVFTAVEPPVSDHPKCKDLVVAYGKWSLTRFNPRASLLRRGPCSDKLFVQLFDSNVGHTKELF